MSCGVGVGVSEGGVVEGMMVKVEEEGPTTHCLACREYQGTVNVNRATRGCQVVLESV